MRPSFLLLSAAFGLAGIVHGQLFLELHGNYLLPVGGYGMSSSTNNTVTSELLNLGRGAGGGLAVGGALSEWLGLEARFTYVSGMEQEFESRSSYTNSSEGSTDRWKSTYMRFEPAVRMSMGSGAIRGYVAVGPSLAFAPKVAYTGTYTHSYVNEFDPSMSYTHTYDETEDYKGGIGWGGFGALGFTWSGGGAVGFFAEVQATAQNWAPSESRNTDEETYTYASGLVESYSDSHTVQYENEFNAGDEHKAPKLQLPLSTWGARAGLRFTFGGAPKPEPLGVQ